MSEQYKAALIRAFMGAVVIFCLTFLGTLQTIAPESAGRYETALVAAGVAFFTYVGGRGLFEGGYDTSRQQHGDIKVSDVGALPPPQTEA